MDDIEARFMPGRARELQLGSLRLRADDLIDVSSAANMHLLPDLLDEKRLLAPAPDLVRTLEQYPPLADPPQDLEQGFARFLTRWTKVPIEPEEVVAFGGVYGAFKTIALAQAGKYVFLPEFTHETHKAAFAALGKTVVEIPIRIYSDNRLDLEFLERQLARRAEDTAFVYLYHAKPAELDAAYYRKIGRLLGKYRVLGLVDLDAWYVAHRPGVLPWLPLTIPALRRSALLLFNMSKELGAPGLRVGFGVMPRAVARHIRNFQQITLDIQSPTSRLLAGRILEAADLSRSRTVLRERMRALIEGLQGLGFSIKAPAYGVNLFLHIPESFEGPPDILPDHLFAYYLLARARIMVRPASSHGHRLNHFVRFVLSQPVGKIKEAIRRLRDAGVRPDMSLPLGLVDEYHSFIKSSRKK
ncbi:MAG: pyridoxal phosphate-dependent aminotransferase [Minisyncoccia bacterium]